jgi:hypothetical protein
MQNFPLAATLEREHHEIDAGIAEFTAAPSDGQPLAGANGGKWWGLMSITLAGS